MYAKNTGYLHKQACKPKKSKDSTHGYLLAHKRRRGESVVLLVEMWLLSLLKLQKSCFSC